MAKEVLLAALIAGIMLVACGYGLADSSRRSVTDLPINELLIGNLPVSVRLGASSSDRALGFQYASPEQIRHEIIYFSYRIPQRPHFHMHNVTAPVLIAWIGPNHHVIARERMVPGVCCYQPPRDIIAALELAPEHPLAKRIHPGTPVRPLRSSSSAAQ